MARLGKINVDVSINVNTNTLNIPAEKIYKLGNYTTIATVQNVPDIKFDLADSRILPLGDFPGWPHWDDMIEVEII